MRLKDLERFERTIKLAAVEKSEHGADCKLSISVGDYRDVEILPDSVIYLDPPYMATREYRHNKEAFDYEAFYDWCERQTSLVVISEYSMPSDRFICIGEKPRISTFSATNNSLERVEKLFVPKGQYGMYKRMMNQ